MNIQYAKLPEPKYETVKSLSRTEPLAITKYLYILCIAIAGMGDWKQINGSFGMYLKVLAFGGFALAALYFLRTGTYRRLKDTVRVTVLFCVPLVISLVISMLIWMTSSIQMSAMTRGLSKLMFQAVTILCVFGGAYMFGSRTLRYTFLGLVIANGAMMGIEMVKHGIGASINSIVRALTSGGDAKGFMRAMEIHDITFCFGLFALYFIFIERKQPLSKLFIPIALFFFILGFKRIAFAGFGLALVVWFILELLHVRLRRTAIYVISFGLFALCWGYVVLIKTGLFVQLMDGIGIELMGRDRIYRFLDSFYEIDVAYPGYGFEYIVALLRGMHQSGTEVIHVTGTHNDILKQYIELGFWGFLIWTGYTYLFQVRWFMKHYGEKAARLVLSLNLYTIITYMTDNTIYYFWLSLTLRTVVIAYICSHEVHEHLEAEARESGCLSDMQLQELIHGGYDP